MQLIVKNRYAQSLTKNDLKLTVTELIITFVMMLSTAINKHFTQNTLYDFRIILIRYTSILQIT